MDFKKLFTQYYQFGGLRLVWQYAKLDVLPIVIKGLFHCFKKRKSFKTIYPDVLSIIESHLINRYGSKIKEFKIINGSRPLNHKHPKVIWWCWLQGFDKAPEIVKACHKSLQENLREYEIIIIDSSNWNQYVHLPNYIIKRWNRKQIPPALFSDLLRLQLLIKYGGSWIDSTVLCTGLNYPKEYMDSDLFLFQYTRPGEKWSGNISNWFISACSHNEVLMVLRDMLFAYWKDYNCTLDYYVFHLFFKMIAEEYPGRIEAMPYGYSMQSLSLMHHWNDSFNIIAWEKLINKVSFHKLSHRVPKEIKNNTNNFYNFIVNDLRER